MPSTYSTNLKLELMATGENSGTWGTKTNTNLGTLLEQAIVGQATVAMADANQTINILDGASSDGRCYFVKCTGALTANRSLTVPTAYKNYVVENATSGGFSVVVKTAAGASVTLPAGARSALYVDNTDVISGFNSIGAVTITQPATSATLTIANGKTFTVSNTLTLTGTDGTSFAFPAANDTIAGLASAQTFTNKTLTDCVGNTQSANNNSTKLATTAYVDAAVGVGVPTGVIFPTASDATPTGWLLCDGSEVSRTTYSALFSAIGTAYGSGDGSTTFNIPDLRGRVLAGDDNMGGTPANRLTSTTMTPNGSTRGATGGSQTATATTTSTGNTSGSLSYSGTTSSGSSSNTAAFSAGVNFSQSGHTHTYSGTTTGNLSVSVSGTSAAFTNVQPSIIVRYIIKY